MKKNYILQRIILDLRKLAEEVSYSDEKKMLEEEIKHLQDIYLSEDLE